MTNQNTFTEAPETETVIDAAASLTGDLAQERVLDLSDMADEPGGPLAPGWYAAEVIEGYATRKGKQIVTSDSPSQDGSSRNALLALKVSPVRGEPRNLQTRFNYRESDFKPERVQYVKSLREDMKGVQGRWPDPDGQRTSLLLAKIGQLGKATKVGVPLTAENTIVVGKFVGAKLDVRIVVDNNGYNEIKEYAESGTKAPKPRTQA
jgi:hypothetical protein